MLMIVARRLCFLGSFAPFQEIIRFGKTSLRSAMRTRAVWLITLSCWNKVLSLWSYWGSRGKKNAHRISAYCSAFTIIVFIFEKKWSDKVSGSKTNSYLLGWSNDPFLLKCFEPRKRW